MTQKPHREETDDLSIVLILFATLFVASVDNQLLIPLVPTLAADLDAPAARVGLLFSAYALAAALFNLILGPLSDRYGRVRFLQAGLAGFALVAALTALSSSLQQLFLLRMGAGVAAGLLSTCTASYVGDYFPYERRGRVMGIILSSYFAALIFGIPISSWIAEVWHWRWIFAGSSVLAGLICLGSLLRLKSVPPREEAPPVLESYRGLLSRRRTLAALVTSFLISGGTLAFLTFISPYLGESYGFSPVQISMVFVVSGLAAITASPLSGMLSDHTTKRLVFLVSNTLLAGALLAIPYLGSGLSFMILVFLVGLCISFRQTALQTLQTELISLERRGTFIALRNGFSQFGISILVFLASTLYESGGFPPVILLAAGVTFLGSAILYWLVPEPGS